MKTNLELTIENSVLQRAKKLAAQQGKNLSEEVEVFLRVLASEQNEFKPEPGSWTESLLESVKLNKDYEGMSDKEILEKEILKKYG